jgi:hypothetical protein
MSDFPLPPKPPVVSTLPEVPVPTPVKRDGRLTDNEVELILTDCLTKKNRNDENVLSFIESFVRCKNVSQASGEAGIPYSSGYNIRHRKDVAHAIQKLIDKSYMKYGFDASEIMERTKEIVDFDPIHLYNPDGTFKENLHDIPAETRRNIKEMKVQNLYNTEEDINGIKKKIIIGRVIEYKFYDKMKAIDLAGKEKEMFKTTTKVEHTVTKDMASILLAAAKRGEEKSSAFKPSTVVDAEVVKNE